MVDKSSLTNAFEKIEDGTYRPRNLPHGKDFGSLASGLEETADEVMDGSVVADSSFTLDQGTIAGGIKKVKQRGAHGHVDPPVPPEPPPEPPPPPPPDPVDNIVTTTAELVAALTAAHPTGGVTIGCDPGSYTTFALVNLNFETEVIITSTDEADLAKFTNSTIDNCSNITFDTVEVLAALPILDVIKVTNSDHIKWTTSFVHGPGPTIDSSSRGITFTNCTDIEVSKNDFQLLARGVIFSGSSMIEFFQNHLHALSSDAVDFAACQDVNIYENYIHNLSPYAAAHPDGIQFWTQGTTVKNERVHIYDNLLWIDSGSQFQAIFMADEVGSLPLTDFEIDGNLIVGTGLSACRAFHAQGINVHDNELITYAGTGMPKIYILIQNSDDVQLIDNITLATACEASNCTNVTKTGNTTNVAVSDSGAAAITAWRATHPNVPT